MKNDFRKAMLLAAGHGLRMRPLTLTRPKPLVEISGKPLIDYAMDRLRAAGITEVIINVHYLPEQIENWARQQMSPHIVISDERNDLLDTGGGIAHALEHFDGTPFFVLNSDSFWLEGAIPALGRLAEDWQDEKMDCLLLLCPLERTVGYAGKGDFLVNELGQVARRQKDDLNALAYAGAYAVHPRMFVDAPQRKFSMNELWNRAITNGKLYGLVHDGLWFHVGEPSSIPLAEAVLGQD